MSKDQVFLWLPDSAVDEPWCGDVSATRKRNTSDRHSRVLSADRDILISNRESRLFFIHANGCR